MQVYPVNSAVSFGQKDSKTTFNYQANTVTIKFQLGDTYEFYKKIFITVFRN